MMTITVSGANGGIGRLLVGKALEKGYQVKAYVRNPEKMNFSNPELTLIKGELFILKMYKINPVVMALSKYIYIRIIIFFILLSFPNFVGAKDLDGRKEYNMNTDWAFFRGDIKNGENLAMNDSDWTTAAIPHIMQLEKKHCGGDGIYGGIGWYRRYFKLPEGSEGKRIALSFEGVMNNCEVFVNGEKVAVNHGGYIGFTTDISEKIKYNGENNLLAVRVSAAYDSITPPGKPQDRLDFYYYSGIYRDVKMIVTDRLHITDELQVDRVAGGGVFVTYPKVDKKEALVKVKTDLVNGYAAIYQGTLHTLLKDEHGKVVASKKTTFNVAGGNNQSVEQTLLVKNPKLWHPYAPNLYTLESHLISGKKIIDNHEEKIGIRTITYTKEKGLFINGEHLYLIGANRHQSYPYVGDAASNSMQEREVIDMKRGGYNAVRAAHYPQDPAFLDACDKYGLLVVECVPGWQYFSDHPVFSDRLEQVTRNMIRRDRNHPSIVLWETALNETRYPLSVVKRIYDAAHEEYPGNQFYTAGDYYSHEETEPYYDVFYKQVAHYPKDGSVMSNYLEDQVSIKPLFTREWGDGVGEKPRVWMGENEQEQMRQCRSRYWQLNGNGYFDWCMLDANPRMGGHFMWSYNDYNRGAEEQTMYCGVVDVNRYPKFAYYMMQSMRSKDISQPGLYEGPMIHIASFNSSADYPSATTDVTIFSNCDEVHLYRNGRFIDRKTRKSQTENYRPVVEKGGSPCYIFNIGNYEAGELKAEGYINGKIAVTHSARTPEKPHHIIVEVPNHSIYPVADGSDMIPVYFKICDTNGTIVNTSDAEISIIVSGEGHLIGDSIRRIGINPQKVEGGVGFAFVRTTKNAGEIRISASSENLEAGAVTLNTYPFKGTYLPDGIHADFKGREEDGVVVKPTKWDKAILSKPMADISTVEATSTQSGYPLQHITDKDDFSWWIAGENSFPQTVTLTLKEKTALSGSRIRFQKDSSTYGHKVETSTDGENWELLYETECTGWDFKPKHFRKEVKYFRLVFKKASEGRAALAEITLFKE